MRRKRITTFILLTVFIVAMADKPVFAAQENSSGKTDIIEESRQQREKLRESINNARAVLDSVSSSEGAAGRDSIDVIRHTNGSAPPDYKSRGQQGSRKYDASKIYGSNSYNDTSKVVKADYINTEDNQVKIGTADTIGNTSEASQVSSDDATGDVGSANSVSGTVLSTGSSSAPIVKSSNQAMSEKVKGIYNLIPEPIRSDFEGNGWDIKIVPDDEIREKAGIIGKIPRILGTVAGLTVMDEDTIYLNDKYADGAMTHEMGHYVDMVLLGSSDWPPSFSSEFRDIYESEREGFNANYPKSSAHEYFAETFGLYIEFAGDLQRDFPRTYEYMDRIISPYGGTTTQGRTMTKAEKDERYGIDFSEVIDMMDATLDHWEEVLDEINRGLNTPEVKKAQSKGGKSALDSLLNAARKGVNTLNK